MEILKSHRSIESGEDSVKIVRKSSILLSSQLNENEKKEYENIVSQIKMGMQKFTISERMESKR